MLAKISRIPGSLWNHTRSISKIWLLSQMFVWNIVIRFFKPFVAVKRLVALAAPKNSPKKNININDVLRNLQWFQYFRVSGKDGDCMVKALVLFRFLSFANENPKLFIGFDHLEGHAWVEVQGDPIREPSDTPVIYKPIMVLNTGSRLLLSVESNQ